MVPLQFFVSVVTPIYILTSKDLELGNSTNRKEHVGCLSGFSFPPLDTYITKKQNS